MPNKKPHMEKLDLKSLDRDYFWGQRTDAVIQKLLENFQTVERTSYVHDETPSVLINRKIKMYLPNSVHLNEMESNQYNVIIDDENSYDKGEYYTYDDLNFAMDKVQELLELCDPWKALIKELEEEASELIMGGNSSVKSIGIGMYQVIERIQFKLKEINENN